MQSSLVGVCLDCSAHLPPPHRFTNWRCEPGKCGRLLRQPNAEDLRIPRSKIKRATFTKTSIMPEGLLESMKPDEVASLFAYLRTLK